MQKITPIKYIYMNDMGEVQRLTIYFPFSDGRAFNQYDRNIKYVDPIQQYNELNYPVQSSDTNVIEP